MMKSLLLIVFALAFAKATMLHTLTEELFGRKDRPVKYEDTQPRLEIRLSPPRHPLPEVSGKIEILDRARRESEEREMGKLIKSFDEEMNRSRLLIISLIRKAFEAFDDPVVIPKKFVRSSFYQPFWSHIRQGKVWISVEGAPPIDGSVLKRLESIEERNTKEEFELFKGAVDDMHEVTRFTLQKLNETLVNTMRPVINTTSPDRNSSYSSFIALQAGNTRCLELQEQFGHSKINCDDNGEGPHAHTISAFASEHTYPTVESLLRDMLARREVDEELFQARSLALMAKLAQEQSKIVAETLQAAVTTIRIQYNDVIQATNLTRHDYKVYNKLHAKTSR